MLIVPELWLGTQDSLIKQIRHAQAYEQNSAEYLKAEQAWRASLRSGRDEYDSEPISVEAELAKGMIEVHDSVGLVSVNGSMVSSTSWMDGWFGRVSYPTMATAINLLLETPEVEKILISWNTDGGDAEGVYDLGAFIKEADKVKPIHSWIGKKAFSAGYWAAASARSVRASELGQAGSIGVVASFSSVARMLKEYGIDVHIERSSPDKAPLHPAEPLSDRGKAYMQEQVAHLQGYFEKHIMAARPQLTEANKGAWATGKTFFANEAIELGLVDGPTVTLGKLISKLNSGNRGKQSPGAIPMAKQMLLSEQALAQAELGMGEAIAPESAPAEAVEGVQTETAATQPETSAAASPATTTLKAEPIEESQVVTLLKEQLTARETALSAAQLELHTVKAQLAAQSADASHLKPAAEFAITRLQVALGQSPIALEGLPATSLAAQFEALQAKFNASFPTGQKTTGATRTVTAESLPQTLAEARVAMVPTR